DHPQHHRRKGARTAGRAPHGQGRSLQGDATMTDIDLLPTDIDGDLRENVRALLAERAPAQDVARVYDEPDFDVPALDAGVFEELELAGLVIPEADGGDGAGLSAAGTVASELGRVPAPSQFLGSAVTASRIVFRAAAAERRT